MASHHPKSVKHTGALIGECLIGIRPLNFELIVRIAEPQPAGSKGAPIVGGFSLLNAGSGKYHEQLEEFVGRSFESVRMLLNELRRVPGAHKASHILNTGELVSLSRLLETLPSD